MSFSGGRRLPEKDGAGVTWRNFLKGRGESSSGPWLRSLGSVKEVWKLTEGCGCVRFAAAMALVLSVEPGAQGALDR